MRIFIFMKRVLMYKEISQEYYRYNILEIKCLLQHFKKTHNDIKNKSLKIKQYQETVISML